ncbi:hypothetical protein NLI96_g5054 [Meripilus lineatus]|uniref:Transmembrane protein n=1 Tax=Meripilus lineatus TaxID=2056292 RepID=A0AAD5YJB9_9APHY|nr:hypothetical protein NLI96_g5054 [Physisporinus lineatus]
MPALSAHVLPDRSLATVSGNTVHSLPPWAYGLIVGAFLVCLVAGFLVVKAIRRRSSNVCGISDIESQVPVQPANSIKSLPTGFDVESQLTRSPPSSVLSSFGTPSLSISCDIPQENEAGISMIQSSANGNLSLPESEVPPTPSLLAGDEDNASKETIDVAEVPHLYISPQFVSMKAIVLEWPLDATTEESCSTDASPVTCDDFCEPQTPTKVKATTPTEVFRFCGNTLIKRVSPSDFDTRLGLSRFFDFPLVEDGWTPDVLDESQGHTLLPSSVFRDL